MLALMTLQLIYRNEREDTRVPLPSPRENHRPTPSSHDYGGLDRKLRGSLDRPCLRKGIMNWLRRWLRKAVPQSAGEALIMAAALVLVLVVLMATLAGR